jgi:hypothetical protein
VSLVISIIVAVLILRCLWAFITGAARFVGWLVVVVVVLAILSAL